MSFRRATRATTSKYVHQREAASASPSTAESTTPGPSSTPAAPMPIATIDSPSAMMTMSP